MFLLLQDRDALVHRSACGSYIVDRKEQGEGEKSKEDDCQKQRQRTHPYPADMQNKQEGKQQNEQADGGHGQPLACFHIQGIRESQQKKKADAA